MGIVSWVLAHWETLFYILVGVLSVAALVARFTKTETDDLWIGRIRGWLEFLRPKAKSGADASAQPMTMADERAEATFEKRDEPSKEAADPFEKRDL